MSEIANTTELVKPVHDFLVVNPETQEIFVPETEKMFGVYGDSNVERKYFKCPRIVKNNIDLATCKVYVNYMSMAGNYGHIQCTDRTVEEDCITFSWLLSSRIFDVNRDNDILFALQFVKQSVNEDGVSKENVLVTREAVGYGKHTVDGIEQIAQEYPDLLQQFIDRLEEVEDVSADWLAKKTVISPAEIIWPASEVNFTGTTKALAAGKGLIAGGHYIVTWNGEKYEMTAYMEEDDTICIGNSGLIGFSTVTDDPFVIYSLAGTSWCTVHKESSDTEAITIQIESVEVVEYNKMPIEYMPEEAIKQAVNDYLKENPLESGTSDAVQYIAQTLTEEQKAQARTNIGAASAKEVGRLSEEKVDLPKDAEGNLIVPTEGQTLLFKADGTTYYGTPTTGSGGNSGGSDDGNGDDNTGGDSEEIVETKLTATFVGCGTPKVTDGVYTLSGGSTRTTNYIPPSSEAAGNPSGMIDARNSVLKMVFPTTELATGDLQYGIFRSLTGDFEDSTVEVFNVNNSNASDSVWNTGTPSGYSMWHTVTQGSEVTFEKGYYYVIFLHKGTFSSNANIVTYANTLLEIYLVSGGSSNSGTSTEVSTLSVDDDYASDYGVSTLSLITDEAETLATETGINAEFATVIETAKNEWMIEANGNINKIPLIIHTDQHTNFLKPLWDTISGLVDWYDVGKVINLGDTVNAYVNSDAEHPYTKCADLENYIASMESVPYSKRIEIFGNHDTWQTVDGATVGITPHNYLNKYFRNIYARKADNYGNFVVYDNNYNVKYIAVSGFAYDSEKGGYSHYIIPSDSINWIISEMEKEDGYDVIILSHVPLNKVNWTSLNALWASRKLKTSGSVTDEYGVVHDFDFTSCDGELLCGLHGHNHEDGCEYINDVLLSNWFDAYYISPRCIHFVLVDRENGQLNIWKVDDTPQYQNYQIPFNKPTE